MVLSWNSTSEELVTVYKGDLKDRAGRPTDIGQIGKDHNSIFINDFIPSFEGT